MTRIFDTSTVKGIRQAERFKARLNNTCQSVNVYAIGLYRVQIVGLGRVQSRNLGQDPQVVSDRQA